MEVIREFYQKIKLIKTSKTKQLWIVRNKLDGETCVAKLQICPTSQTKKKGRNVLHEAKFLQTMQGYKGIPFLHWAGKDESMGLSMLITERLGKNVGQELQRNGGTFCIKTMCQIGVQLFELLHLYHDKGFAHGNICPHSLQFGLGRNSNTLYFNDLIDSITYLNKNRKHLAQGKSKINIKVNQFMTVQRLQGQEASRRQDIYNAVLVLIYFINGSLPWTSQFHQYLKVFNDNQIFDKESLNLSKEETKEQTLQVNDFQGRKNTMQKVKQDNIVKKLFQKIENATNENVCNGPARILLNMLREAKRLAFDETPDYSLFIRELKKIMIKGQMVFDNIYEWTTCENKINFISNKTSFSLINIPFEQEIIQKYYLRYEKDVDLYWLS